MEMIIMEMIHRYYDNVALIVMKALGERMIQEDFKDYTSNRRRKRSHNSIGNNSIFQTSRNNHQSVLKYAMEKRDGSLFHRTLDLNSSVENILENLASAVEYSGAAKVHPPPPQHSPTSQSQKSDSDSIDWIKYNPEQQQNIDHQYNVNSNRGRDLERFLSSITRTQIEERKASRMDATAVTLVARRLFGFQSIDGVRLGWSSKAFTGLLSSLIRLHEEYEQTFGVRSFYPLRLVFSHDEYKHPLDVYGGNLYLKPSATKLEWLKSIKEVTDERLEEFSMNRHSVTERVTLLQEGLGIDLGINDSSINDIKVQKGFTCSPLEYYLFLKRNGEPYRSTASISSKTPLPDSNELVPVLSSSSVCATRRLRLVVESSMSSRRARVTKEGLIQVPSTITSPELISVVTNFSLLVGERDDAEEQEKMKCRKAVEAVQWELGLQKVSRSNQRVCRKDFLSALSRLLDHQPRLSEGCLSGASLRVEPSGQFCHLSDDGAIVIPHNWR
jgi:hypothetical protein